MAFTPEQRRAYYQANPHLKARYMRTWQSKPKVKRRLARYARQRRRAAQRAAEIASAKMSLRLKEDLRRLGVRLHFPSLRGDGADSWERIRRMVDPVFFVVQRGSGGGESPAIIHDILPQELTRKGATALVYAVRLDLLPKGDEIAQRPLADLYTQFCHMRKMGTLPSSTLQPPAKKSGGPRRQLGEWWEPPARTWPERPADPYPKPEEIKPRPDAGGFISKSVEP